MSTDPVTPSPRRPVTLWGVVLAALTLVMWGRFLIFPSYVAADSLDESWAQALAHFYKTSAQAGTDYVFTYGPLGTFATPAYDADCYWQRYVWELVVKLAAAIVIVQALAALSARAWTLLGAALLIVFVPFHFDTIYEVALLAAGVQLIDGASRGRPWFALLVPLLAVLALTKFTYFVLALWAVALAEVAVRLRGYRGLLSPAPLYLASVAAVWLFCGQRPAHLWAYCRNSWEVSEGYGGAMSVPANATDVILGLTALVFPALLLLLSAWRNRRSAFHVTGALFLGPGLFLGWKHGFIRSADDHPFIFFGMALFVVLMLPRFLAPRVSVPLWLTLAVLLLCCAAGIVWKASRVRVDLFAWNWRQTKRNLPVAFHPAERKRRLEEERTDLREEWRLDRVRAEVGDGSVDQLSCAQGVVLLNGLNWHLRPVFQSYTAYTPALLHINADYYRSDGAPDYVLCRLAPVDGRLGSTEDALALMEILRRYYPVAAEKQFVLFKRVPPGEEPPEPGAELVCRRTVRFGEEVRLDDLPGAYQVLSLRFTPSLAGRVRGVCYKRESVALELRTASGRALERRLIPAMATEGFLINPLVDTTADYVRLYGSDGDRVVSFAVTTGGDDFKDEIEVTVTALARLPCRTLDAAVVDAMAPR